MQVASVLVAGSRDGLPDLFLILPVRRLFLLARASVLLDMQSCSYSLSRRPGLVVAKGVDLDPFWAATRGYRVVRAAADVLAVSHALRVLASPEGRG